MIVRMLSYGFTVVCCIYPAFFPKKTKQVAVLNGYGPYLKLLKKEESDHPHCYKLSWAESFLGKRMLPHDWLPRETIGMGNQMLRPEAPACAESTDLEKAVELHNTKWKNVRSLVLAVDDKGAIVPQNTVMP